MNIYECIEMAINSITSNKLRSLLTMLGIIIGISSVIAIVAIGRGGQTAISTEFERLGVNVVAIKNKPMDITGKEALTLEDIAFIKKNLPGVKNITPLFIGTGVLKNKLKSHDVMFFGILPEYRNIYDMKLMYGRLINENDIRSNRRVMVIDELLARKLCGREDIVGNVLKMKSKGNVYDFTVVGVIKNSYIMYESLFGEQFPSFIYIPVGLGQRIYKTRAVDQISISLYNRDQLEEAGALAVNMIERRHRVKDKYFAENTVKQMEKVDKITSILTYIIGAIGAISLIVGGIGVMNIMFISVSERVREIGIRKALGAKKADILMQFLIEAVFITLIGGLIGVITGIIISSFVMNLAKLPLLISPPIIMSAVVFSGVVGIVFGVYPAYRAASLDPIVALRYEQ